jgi:hypothetical protein
MDIPPEDIVVTVVHSWGNITTTLAKWMELGPGPRPLVRVIHPRMKATDQPLPDETIPLAYQNTRESRDLIRRGLLPNPWPGKPWSYPPSKEQEDE